MKLKVKIKETTPLQSDYPIIEKMKIYDLNREMRKYLFLEYYYMPRDNRDQFLLESPQGVDYEILENAKEIGKSIFAEYKTIIDKFVLNNNFKSFNIKLNGGIESEYAKNVKIEINVLFSNKKEIEKAFEYIPSISDDNIDEESKKFKEVNITGRIIAPKRKTENSDMSEIISVLAHELLHAKTDLFQRLNSKRNNSKSKGIVDSLEKSGYFKNKEISKRENVDGLLKELSDIIYYFNPIEVNAFTNELLIEAEPYLKDCDSSEKAWNVIKKERIWKNYEIAEQYVYDICLVKDKGKQQEIMDFWNKVNNTEVIDYNSFLKIILKKWKRTMKQLISRIGRRIANYASENGNWQYI